ncbi:MAG: hypothetical protein WB698_14875 [Solirubrobacteraceae bacterium]
MKLRTLLLLALAALLGAAVVVLPALAAGTPAPSEVKLEVAEHCYFKEWPCWNVKGNNPEDIRQIQPFTIAQNGTISFEDNEAKYPTDVLWKGAAPSCTSGVPSTPNTSWSGTCTFANAGEYEFESQDLFNDGTFNYTKYKVIVEKSGGGGTTSTTTTTTTTTTPTTPTTPSEPSHGSPLEGGLEGGSQALKLASSQHGSTVHGQVKVSQADAGGRLEIGLFATSASVAKAGRPAQRVGRLIRSSLKAGNVSFSVPLTANGKAALRRHRRLRLTVKITLTPQHSAAVTLTRVIVVHA